MDGNVVSTERVIPAPPEAIFDLVADASRHPDIDGSGAVRQAKPGGPERLSLGATFGMSMHLGMKYSMVNTVIEFEENRRIAWQTRLQGLLGKYIGGRIWRYELEPVEGGTRVSESYDVKWIPAWARIVDVPTNRHRELQEAMRHTLERLKNAAEARDEADQR